MEFEVTVDYFVFSDHLEGAFELLEDSPHVLLGQGALMVFLEVSVKVIVAAVLENHVEIIAGLLIVQKGDDVGVLHHRQHFQFLPYPL